MYNVNIQRRRPQFDSWIRKSQWRRDRLPTPVFLPGKSHGRRSLVGCSPWGREESDTTERLHFHFSLSCIGEGNGNPRQCSCLENPRYRGAWWAAVYGVTQSRTWLKWLSRQSCRASMTKHRQRSTKVRASQVCSSLLNMDFEAKLPRFKFWLCSYWLCGLQKINLYFYAYQ